MVTHWKATVEAVLAGASAKWQPGKINRQQSTSGGSYNSLMTKEVSAAMHWCSEMTAITRME